MQPQLFLFDNIKEKESEQPSVSGEVVLTEGETISAEELTDTIPDTFSMAAQSEEKMIADPFAEIKQKQQDEIDTLLLMPPRKRGRKSFKEMDRESILPDIPEDEELYRKQYYPPRMVAEWFGITMSQLRAWENEFDILQPKKNGKGDRFFRPDDVKNLKIIYHLIRRRKFTVQGAKQYMDDNKKKLQTTMQLTESLRKFKQFLLELKAICG